MAIETEHGPFGPARLFLLKRHWLATSDGAAADPEPVANAARARAIPPAAAYPLQVLVAGAPQIGVYALLAAAYALIFGLLGRINLAFGDLAALGGFGALLGVAAAGGPGALLAPIFVALLAGIWTAASFAAASARTVFEPLSRRQDGPADQAALIASAGLGLAVTELIRLAQGPGSKAAPPFLDHPIAIARAGDFIVTVTPMALAATWVAALATSLLLFGLRRSRFGRQWRAVADDPNAAALLGIDTRRLAVATFAIAGALAGLGGALTTLVTGGVSHGYGLLIGLKALLAAILGGTGSVAGAVAGAILIGSVEALWSAAFPIEHRDAAVMTALVLALVLRPGGLAGARL